MVGKNLKSSWTKYFDCLISLLRSYIGAFINIQNGYVCDVETGNDKENFGFSSSGFRVLPGRLDSWPGVYILCVSL